MKKKQIIGLVVAAVLFIVVGVASVLVNTFSQSVLEQAAGSVLSGDYEFDAPSRDYIAIVRVEGTIQEQTADSSLLGSSDSGYLHTTTMEYVDQLIADDNNKGILLYVDSPGGAVYESEELYLKLEQYKEETGRPIWGYMAHYAASGGYMASVAADKIYANQNTTTGSIGVIMSGYDLTGLYEKLGIRYVSITSGANKDSSQLNDEQVAIYQSQVDEAYQSFVEKVVKGREMSEETVRSLADGRTYTAKQAKENGLIDEISLYEDMQAEMMQELGVYEFYEPTSTSGVLDSLFAKAESLVPKSEAQVLMETAEEMESGVLMYYADGLQ